MQSTIQPGLHSALTGGHLCFEIVATQRRGCDRRQIAESLRHTSCPLGLQSQAQNRISSRLRATSSLLHWERQRQRQSWVVTEQVTCVSLIPRFAPTLPVYLRDRAGALLLARRIELGKQLQRSDDHRRRFETEGEPRARKCRSLERSRCKTTCSSHRKNRARMMPTRGAVTGTRLPVAALTCDQMQGKSG